MNELNQAYVEFLRAFTKVQKSQQEMVEKLDELTKSFQNK